MLDAENPYLSGKEVTNVRERKKRNQMPGYQLLATHSCGTVIASYAEADDPNLGAQRCFEQFPANEGYTFHKITEIETGTTYLCKWKEPEE